MKRMTPAEAKKADGVPGPILIVEDQPQPYPLNRARRRALRLEKPGYGHGVPRNAQGRTRHQHSIHERARRRNAIRHAQTVEARAHAAANKAAEEAAAKDEYNKSQELRELLIRATGSEGPWS